MPTSSNGACDDGSITLGCEGHAVHPAAADGEDGFLMALTSGWGSPPLYLSHPSWPFDSLGDGDSIVVHLNGGHGDRPGQVPDLVAGGGEDDPLLKGDLLFSSLPPQPSCGVDDSDSFVVPLGRGHADRTGQVLGMGTGGGEDDSPLSGDVLVYISPTQVDSRQP